MVFLIPICPAIVSCPNFKAHFIKSLGTTNFRHTELSTLSVSEAIKEIEAETYSLDEAPRAYAHKVLGKLAAVKNRFPKESLPSEEFVKRQLYRGLSKTLQDTMNIHLDSWCSLEQFLRSLEHHYNVAVLQGDVTRRRVQAISAPTPSQLPSTAGNNVPKPDPAMQDVLKQLGDLKNKLENLSKKGNNRKYCAFCMVRDHNLADCPNNPPRGVCFDCNRPNCKRGHVNCPGRRPAQ